MSAGTLALERTIAAGLDYILSMQAEDRSWTEWALPPGSSSTWTTAYVGYKLRSLPCSLAAQATPKIAAAASWLCENAFDDGGWGYNVSVGSDADSTAYAILFLASAGLQVPDAAYTRLADFQGADGGFTTYLASGKADSWNMSHQDVSPIALLAMLTHPLADQNVIQRGIAYVLRQYSAQGLWNSFWWDSFLYGTEASLSLLDAAGIEMPSSEPLTRIKPANVFEAALLTSSLLFVDRDGSHVIISDLVDNLIRQQQPNGSWNITPILRITRRDCYEPWASDDAGQLYADPNRLFTTATVLHALTKAYVSIKGIRRE